MAEQIQLNIGICDDEPVMLRLLADRCREILSGSYTLAIDTAESPRELLALEHPLHIVLLDVQLARQSGIDLARDLLTGNPGCRIIFVSGFLSAVSQVYEVPHFCFILKDQLDQQLPKFLLRAAELAAGEAGRTLSVLQGRQTRELPLREILYLERRGHWTDIYLRDGSSLQTREKLTELHRRIGAETFLRCHVSYLVNLDAVQQLEDQSLLLRDGERIPISRPNTAKSREAFFRHLGENME